MKEIELPLPPKGLLVAVDLSRVSLAAWKQAERLGAALGVPLEAVYVNESHPSVNVGDARVELSGALKKQVVEEIRRQIGSEAPIRTLSGDPVLALTRCAASRPGHWLVTGTHGWTGLQRLLHLGSVVEALVIGSPVPILTLRKGPRGIRSILAPVAAGRQSWHGFQYAAELAWRLNASLTPLHVVADRGARAAGAALAARLVSRLPVDLRRVCAKPIVAVGKVEAQVVAAAARRDLVVLTADRELLFREVLLGGKTARVLRFSPVPVLTLPSGVASRTRAWRRTFARS